jgi:hypothetical protein
MFSPHLEAQDVALWAMVLEDWWRCGGTRREFDALGWMEGERRAGRVWVCSCWSDGGSQECVRQEGRGELEDGETECEGEAGSVAQT